MSYGSKKVSSLGEFSFVNNKSLIKHLELGGFERNQFCCRTDGGSRHILEQ